MNIQNIDEKWEKRFLDYFAKGGYDHDDASHDLSHFRRVAHTAHHIAVLESAAIDTEVLLAAAYFHDIVTLPKNHPDNRMSSRYSSAKAKEILDGMNFPAEKIESVCHAIEAH
ncbi:MAG: HD domain-containing protein, partial [Ignavibacteria bacterium]